LSIFGLPNDYLMKNDEVQHLSCKHQVKEN